MVRKMAGYLEERQEDEGHLLRWQTPNRQRLWGILGSLIPAAIMAHGLYGFKKPFIPEIIAGAFLLLACFLVATWTVKFTLNLNDGTYQFVKGFLPILLGEKGKARDAFQCVAVRIEEMVDAKKHEGDPDAPYFEQYRVFMIWKEARREAMLLDTIPESYAESLKQRDFYAEAIARAKGIATPLKLSVLDQAVAHAVVEMEDAVATKP